MLVSGEDVGHGGGVIVEVFDKVDVVVVAADDDVVVWVIWQTPLKHDQPYGQRLEHLPQLRLSVKRSDRTVPSSHAQKPEMHFS